MTAAVVGQCQGGTNALQSPGNWVADDTTITILHAANKVELIISLERLMPCKHSGRTDPCTHKHWKCFWAQWDGQPISGIKVLIGSICKPCSFVTVTLQFISLRQVLLPNSTDCASIRPVFTH